MVVGHKVYHDFKNLKKLFINPVRKNLVECEKSAVACRCGRSGSVPQQAGDAPVNPCKLGGDVKHLTCFCVLID